MEIKPVILDTNVVLDLLVFQDPRTDRLRHSLQQQEIHFIYSPEIFLEYRNVIARPQFAQSLAQQQRILATWQELACLMPSPPSCNFCCADQNDQMFIDLAYYYRPCMLLSKDIKIIQMHKRMHMEGVEIQTYPVAF